MPHQCVAGCGWLHMRGSAIIYEFGHHETNSRRYELAVEWGFLESLRVGAQR